MENVRPLSSPTACRRDEVRINERKHFRRERGTAHAEQEHMRQAIGVDLPGEIVDLLDGCA